jgi:isochorismate synthase EntC
MYWETWALEKRQNILKGRKKEREHGLVIDSIWTLMGQFLVYR